MLPHSDRGGIVIVKVKQLICANHRRLKEASPQMDILTTVDAWAMVRSQRKSRARATREGNRYEATNSHQASEPRVPTCSTSPAVGGR